MTKRNKKNKRNKRNRSDKIKIWLLYSILYAIFYSILSGTLTYYFNTIPLGLGLYMNLPDFFVMMGLSGWVLLTFLILKGDMAYTKVIK